LNCSTWNLNVDQGALLLMPCPGTKGVSLETSLQQLANDGCQAVISLITTEEMEEKGVTNFGDCAKDLNMKWFHFPIRDDSVPDAEFLKEWKSIREDIHSILDKGGKVAIHCMGGSGRTGMIAFHVLHERKWNLEDIVSKVQALRPHAYIFPGQLEYCQSIAKSST
jgi:protein-tyrosine phosphatase